MWKILWEFPRMFCSVTCPTPSTVFQITCKIFVWVLTVLKSEVYDLRIVLQSADKELSAVKSEYSAFREKQEKEMSQLSGRHMDVQFQLDSVRYVCTWIKCLNLPSGCIQWFCCSFLHVNLHFTSLILCLYPLIFFFLNSFHTYCRAIRGNMMKLAEKKKKKVSLILVCYRWFSH